MDFIALIFFLFNLELGSTGGGVAKQWYEV